MGANFLPWVIGHRGAAGYAPENTMAAFKKAHELGISWVEFDVQLARCGEAVLMHDSTINRTTSGRGSLQLLAYQALQTLDAGTWFHAQFQSEIIPTLSQVLAFLDEHHMTAVIELKPCLGTERECVSGVAQILKKMPSSARHILSSFSEQVLYEVRQQLPHQKIALGLHTFRKNWEKIARDLQCSCLHINYKWLTEKRVRTIRDKGFEIYSYTVNKPAIATKLVKWGVAALFSDFPDRIQMAIKHQSIGSVVS